jgi:protein pelota
MKLVKKQISAKDGSGMVLLRPDTPEDLWHAYNLLQNGDLVRCTTHRKVVKESTTGSVSSHKMRMMLTVALKQVDFDPVSLQVRLSGTVQQENDFVRLGSHHTLTLELNQNFSIEKSCWDQVFLDLLDEATHPEQQAEIAAVVLQGTGLAHVCLVTGALTITKARIDVNIPKKRTGSSQHAKATTKFFEAIYKAILLHIDFTKVKCIVVGSPGFLANDWLEYTKLESVRRNDRPFIENKSKFVLCKASSGHKHALEEIFSDPTIAAQMTETKVAREVVILQKFMRLMDTDADRAYYGYDHVAKVDEQLAIDSLLVTDELFRASDVATRKRYVGLVESVRANGGQVYVFSSMHVSGQQLQQVSGIAAILRYPLPDLDQLEELAASADYQPSAAAYDDRRYDAERRIREDLLDMGL